MYLQGKNYCLVKITKLQIRNVVSDGDRCQSTCVAMETTHLGNSCWTLSQFVSRFVVEFQRLLLYFSFLSQKTRRL